jgi:hypothetical protein
MPGAASERRLSRVVGLGSEERASLQPPLSFRGAQRRGISFCAEEHKKQIPRFAHGSLWSDFHAYLARRGFSIDPIELRQQLTAEGDRWRLKLQRQNALPRVTLGARGGRE